MNPQTIAVLLTCHNRKQNTLDCLERLSHQAIPSNFTLKVYLVDDGSTDGTGEAVAQQYPQVTVLPGDGNLFWNGGMRVAFAEAMQHHHDFYLWLNDDTMLYPGAIAKALDAYQDLITAQNHGKVIITGATKGSNGELSYGGIKRHSWWYPLKVTMVPPAQDHCEPCDSMNGNFVLIPQEVVAVVGNLEEQFVHNFGDYDYGYRASKQGCSIWLLPGYIGECDFHLPKWREESLSLQEKLKAVKNPKGMTLNEWKVYSQRHGGPLWPIYWLLPYVKLVVTSAFKGK
jgi:GT2 family glycosyltransferase